MFPSTFKQKGSALVVAIFIIVVMAILAAVIARVLTISSSASVDEVYGARALQAANSGMQVFLTELFPLQQAESEPSGADASACQNPTNPYSFQQATGLSGCSSEISCEQISLTDFDVTLFRITSRGRCAAAERIYSREIMVEAIDEGV